MIMAGNSFDEGSRGRSLTSHQEGATAWEALLCLPSLPARSLHNHPVNPDKVAGRIRIIGSFNLSVAESDRWPSRDPAQLIQSCFRYAS
jgi:hypothetical protein